MDSNFREMNSIMLTHSFKVMLEAYSNSHSLKSPISFFIIVDNTFQNTSIIKIFCFFIFLVNDLFF
jgi:hypothetical protein